MIWSLTLPILMPFATAAAAFLARDRRGSGWISVAGSVVSLGLAIHLVMLVLHHGVIAGQVSGWAAPFGITLAADYLAAAMVLITEFYTSKKFYPVRAIAQASITASISLPSISITCQPNASHF